MFSRGPSSLVDWVLPRTECFPWTEFSCKCNILCYKSTAPEARLRARPIFQKLTESDWERTPPSIWRSNNVIASSYLGKGCFLHAQTPAKHSFSIWSYLGCDIMLTSAPESSFHFTGFPLMSSSTNHAGSLSGHSTAPRKYLWAPPPSSPDPSSLTSRSSTPVFWLQTEEEWFHPLQELHLFPSAGHLGVLWT